MAETKINANQTDGLMKQYDAMPTADTTMVGAIVQYTGATSSPYTKGYFYKCIEQQNPGTATAAKSASSITSVSVDASRFMEKMAYYFPNHAISGENVFQWSSDSWCFKLLPENLDVNMMVEEGDTFLEGIKVLGVTYSPDYASFSDGDTITITYTPAPSTYLWESSPTGNAIENTATGNNSLTISGNPSSYMNSINIGTNSSATSAQAIAIGINSSAANSSIIVGNNTTTSNIGQVLVGQGITDTGQVGNSVGIGRWVTFVKNGATAAGGVAIGESAQIGCGNGVAIGSGATIGGGLTESGVAIGRQSGVEGINTNSAMAIGPHTYAADGLAIGYYVSATANYAIQIGMSGTSRSQIINSDANTFKVANANGNFEIMSANGTIPTDRFTTTPSADGTYIPSVTVSNGVAARTWQGADYVVDFQTPTAANDYTWYRKYKSGWVEQGANYINNTSTNTFNLPITMSDTNYSVILNAYANMSSHVLYVTSRTTTSISLYHGDNKEVPFSWQVSGMAAQ